MSAEAVAYAIVRRLPYVLIKEPERVLISFISIVIGLAMLVPYFHPNSIEDALRPPMVYAWAFCFLFGGAAKLYALMTISKSAAQTLRKIESARSFERVGASLIALGTAIYGIVLAEVAGISGLMAVLLFLGIALTNLIRLVVSVANGKITDQRGA